MKAIWAALAFVAMAGLVGVPGAGAQPAVAASAPATGLPPAELFFRHPDFQTARLSPSGRWLAASVGLANGRFGLGVFDLSGATPPAVVAHFRDTDIGYFNWVSDARLVYNVVDLERGSGDPRYAPGLFSVTRDGSETRHLVKMRRDFITGPPRTGDRTLPANHTLLHVPSGEGDEVIVGEWMFSRWRELEALVPKRLNIVTGQVSSIAHGMPSGATGWLFDASGKPRVALVRREGRLSIHWRAQLEGDAAPAWAEIGRFDTLKAPWSPQAVDPAGQLYVTVPEGSAGETVLKRFDFATGRPEVAPVVSTPGFDFDGGVIAEHSGGRVMGVRANTDAEVTVWLDPRMKAIQEQIDRRLPGRVNRLSCRRCASPEITVLVQSWSDRDPGQFWVWRGEPEAPTLWQAVGQRRKGVDPQKMASLDFTRFAARDGRGIPLWVTVPAGPSAGPRPAVVMPHGGPWVRGGQWGWNPMAQFLASRGYVVLEPEFRGSTGYGAAHFRAGWKQWGRAMQDDLADAVAWAAGKGLVDANRVCIIGASYGGYATLMGLVRHPDVYRCGAAWVAVTEPRLLFDAGFDNDVSEEVRQYTLPVLLGDPESDAQMLRDVSPVVQAERLRAPLLLAFGERDRRVPLEHGKRLRDALTALGREPEYVVYEGEGHSWQKTQSRIDFARRLERFLLQHLGPPD